MATKQIEDRGEPPEGYGVSRVTTPNDVNPWRWWGTHVAMAHSTKEAAITACREHRDKIRRQAIEDVIAWCEAGYEGLDREKAVAFGVFGLLREVPDSIRRRFLDEVTE